MEETKVQLENDFERALETGKKALQGLFVTQAITKKELIRIGARYSLLCFADIVSDISSPEQTTTIFFAAIFEALRLRASSEAHTSKITLC